MKQNKLLIILGSVRQGRAADGLLATVKGLIKPQDGIDISVADPLKLNLPLFDDSATPSDPSFSPKHKGVIELIGLAEAADAVLILSPEYNHGIPAALKNLLDWTYQPWKGKRAGLVGYGWHGAPFARKHLHDVLDRLGFELLKPDVELVFKTNIEIDGSPADSQPGTGALKQLRDLINALNSNKTA